MFLAVTEEVVSDFPMPEIQLYPLPQEP